MKKMLLVMTALVCVLALAGCSCEHEWAEANCTAAKTCKLCKETEGSPLGHSWVNATCTAPKTCENCGVTDGEAKGHAWSEATCTEPETCSVCHETKGEPLNHAWEDTTTEVPKTCTNCQTTEGTKIETDPRFTTESTRHLYGLWSCDVVLTGEMLGMDGYLDELECTVFYEFRNDGTAVRYFEVHDVFAYKEAMKKAYIETMYETMTKNGISKDQIEKSMQENYGMSLEEYVDATVEEFDVDAIFSNMNRELVYYISDGKIYKANSWRKEFEESDYTLEGDELIIQEDVLVEGGEPLVWTKVS